VWIGPQVQVGCPPRPHLRLSHSESVDGDFQRFYWAGEDANLRSSDYELRVRRRARLK
jgi:hypothetical protein